LGCRRTDAADQGSRAGKDTQDNIEMHEETRIYAGFRTLFRGMFTLVPESHRGLRHIA
jgi:hypothetical protein